MGYDFLKNFSMLDDEERFSRLYNAFDEVVRDFADADSKLTDSEIMQALDMVGFSLFRDSWEEFKKHDMRRDFSLTDFKAKHKKLLH